MTKRISERMKIENAVDSFSAAMKERLHNHRKDGFTGWRDVDFQDDISDRMVSNAQHAHRHNDEESLIDVANLAMMRWMFVTKESNDD